MNPFNLEAAKAGAPICTREGDPVKFIAHVPEATIRNRVIILIGKTVYSAYEDGKFCEGQCYKLDLFMAVKTVTYYINFYQHSCAAWYSTETEARKKADPDRAIAIAVPVTIEI